MKTWLDFVEHIITAWPLCAFGIALLFRKDIRALLKRLHKISARGVTADFASGKVTALEARVDTVIDDNPAAAPAQDQPLPLAAEIAETSPAAALSYAWAKVEQALRDKMRRIEPDVNLVRINSVSRRLHKKGKIKTETLEILTDMRKLRDELIRSEDTVTSDLAADYSGIAGKLLGIISAIPS